VVGTCDWGRATTAGFPPKLAIDTLDSDAAANVADHFARVVDWVKRVHGGAKAGAASFGRKTNTGHRPVVQHHQRALEEASWSLLRAWRE
jgi:hypothetical protein